MTIWKAQRTLLIVGVGYVEEAFLNHVKKLYAPRGCGLSVSIKNARGKGAKHVIDWTRRQTANADYDAVAAMLDTDQDWSEAVAKQAKSARIEVLKSEPCFEAMMLRLLGQSTAGDSKALKRRFAPYVNNDPMRSENYATNFGKAFLDASRNKEPSLDALLKLFGA
jgi:hypothetical protein